MLSIELDIFLYCCLTNGGLMLKFINSFTKRAKTMCSKPATKRLMDKKEMATVIEAITYEILEEFPHDRLSDIAFIGIQTRGVPFARRLAAKITEKTKVEVGLGILDISMHRDDIGMRDVLPHIRETDIPFDVNDKTIILVDDVLFTGRTIRAALDAITDYGRPAMIRLAVLVDRLLREFPIRSDYTGEIFNVPQKHKVRVEWEETSGEDAVYECPPSSKSEKPFLIKN